MTSRQKHRPSAKPKLSSIIFPTILVFFLASATFSQSLPSKIRGYKVYDAKVDISNSGKISQNLKDFDASVTFDNPHIANIGLSGTTIEIGVEITAPEHSGRVDLITFRDVKVDGIEVGVDDYSTSFSFRKGERIRLSKPARVTIRPANMVRAVYRELLNKHNEITLTGTAFVFGKFKKFGFTFKRVVPVRFDVKVKNPLRFFAP
ncbi:hypothetical protein BH10ACI2_BH10ACI2_18190 [soil metagenome]